jgi:hypothetical protein
MSDDVYKKIFKTVDEIAKYADDLLPEQRNSLVVIALAQYKQNEQMLEKLDDIYKTLYELS